MSTLRKNCEKLQNVFQSHTMTSIIDSKRFVFVISGLLGAVFFMIFFGIRVLDVTYTDWLVIPSIQDRYANYIGWEAYRNSDWFFPPGLHDGLTYPFPLSVAYSDALPVFALFFKAISFILPADFQYFGWVCLIWYILQGGFGGLIVKRISGYTWFSIICSLFFTLSVFMAYRMLNHSGLAAHFLLLATMYMCITKDDNRRSVLKNCIIWSILMVVSIGASIYMSIMIFGMMCFYFLDDVFEHKKIVRVLIELCVPMVFMVIAMFLFGFFSSNADNSTFLGVFNANLNQPFNPNAVYAEIGSPYADFSRIIPPLPLIPAEVGFVTESRQSEGNSYPGLGMLIFFLLAIIIFIYDFKKYKSKLSDKKILRRTIFVIIVFFAYYFYALGPTFTFGDKYLISYYRLLPGFYIDLMSMFRSTGRFLWVPVYMLMILAIWVAAKKFKKPILLIMAVLLVCVQFYDQSGYLFAKGKIFREEQVFETSLQSEFWDVIAKDYDHMIHMNHFDFLDQKHLTVFAVRNRLTLNNAYVARQDVTAIEDHQRHQWELLAEGLPDENTVYIFYITPEYLIQEDLLVVYHVDGRIVGVANEIENAINMTGVDRIT